MKDRPIRTEHPKPAVESSIRRLRPAGQEPTRERRRRRPRVEMQPAAEEGVQPAAPGRGSPIVVRPGPPGEPMTASRAPGGRTGEY
nr:hypothetical protein KPHV_72260 [Kitasatospora purpeofusca]